MFLHVLRLWDAIYEEIGSEKHRGSSFITLHRPPFLKAVLTSPFRPSQVSTLSDPFPFKPQESQHSFSSLQSPGKVIVGGKKKQNTQTAKETMQAKTIGKIPLRNDKKVLKIESRAEKEPPSRD